MAEEKNEQIEETQDAAAAEADATAKPAEKPAEKPAAKAEGKAAEKPAAKAAEKPAAKAEDKSAKKPAKKAPAKKSSTARGKPAAKAPDAEPVLVRATARYVRSSPRKARLVVDHIRNQPVEEARVFLRFTARHAGRDVAKVLESAIANAEHNHELAGDELHVVKAYVDEGPTLKRWRPRAKGRATPILKRTSHITVVVSNLSNSELKNRKVAA